MMKRIPIMVKLLRLLAIISICSASFIVELEEDEKECFHVRVHSKGSYFSYVGLNMSIRLTIKSMLSEETLIAGKNQKTTWKHVIDSPLGWTKTLPPMRNAHIPPYGKAMMSGTFISKCVVRKDIDYVSSRLVRKKHERLPGKRKKTSHTLKGITGRWLASIYMYTRSNEHCRMRNWVLMHYAP